MANTITGHRSPTPCEIRFGEGTIHYKDFDREQWEIFIVGGKRTFSTMGEAMACAEKLHHIDGTVAAIERRLKAWIVCPHDGLRYQRGG